MTDPLDERARRATMAVRDKQTELDADRGLDRVLTRGRRPAPAPILAVLLVVLLAVPAAIWLMSSLGSESAFDIADEPPGVEAPEPDADPGVDSDDPTPPPGTDSSDEPQVTPPSGPEPLGQFSKDDVTSPDYPHDAKGQVYLTDVRVGSHDGFDRVVLEFEGTTMSPYRVAFTDPPIRQAGSGDPIHVDGNAFLELHFTAASGVTFETDDPQGYELTYEGPNRVRAAGTSVITEVVRTGDFEATLSWVVGLRTEAPFAVTVLQSPLRLVVDIETS